MEFASGEILTIDGFQKGYISFEKNKIITTEKGTCPKKPVVKGLIVPGFVNAHIHIGDSFIKKKHAKLPRNIETLVGPPNGLKHRLLSSTSNEEIVNGMIDSIYEMKKSGVSIFCDFREGGIDGLNLLNLALKNQNISPIIFSRPNNLKYNSKEINNLLNFSNGIGLSSISDWEYPEIVKIVKHVKKKNKMFGLHASERVREDIDIILDLKPDFLVHMIKATESDFIKVKENNISVIICPRSNYFFGIQPNYKLIKKTDTTFLIGTDNSMLNNPSILDEIFFIKQKTNLFSMHELLHTSTYIARKALNQECGILDSNLKADFVVLDKKTFKPLFILNK
ncbi:MAG: amidohydrolase family protein [Candidatus Thermoplasmatota archaeon]|nr:amidohydrolase family protein [Candidatus Thermoplasmatota archaeon]